MVAICRRHYLHIEISRRVLVSPELQMQVGVRVPYKWPLAYLQRRIQEFFYWKVPNQGLGDLSSALWWNYVKANRFQPPWPCLATIRSLQNRFSRFSGALHTRHARRGKHPPVAPVCCSSLTIALVPWKTWKINPCSADCRLIMGLYLTFKV